MPNLPSKWSAFKPIPMIAPDLLHLLGLGGVCGLFGQLIRSIIGLKKGRYYSSKDYPFKIDFGRLVVGGIIGFMIGAIFLLLLHQDPDEPIDKSMVFIIMAFGYAVVDLLEGLLGFFKSPLHSE